MVNSPQQAATRLICSPESNLLVIADQYVSLTAPSRNESGGSVVVRGTVQAPQSVGLFPDSACRVKYFEVTIVKKDPQDTVIVGLAPPPTRGVVMKQGPGFVSRSVGLSSDGFLVSGGASSAVRYGNSFGAGDTIGCGYDTTTRDLFFTRNGTRLPPVPTLQRFGWDAEKSHPTVHLSGGRALASRVSVFINLRGATSGPASPANGFKYARASPRKTPTASPRARTSPFPSPSPRRRSSIVFSPASTPAKNLNDSSWGSINESLESFAINESSINESSLMNHSRPTSAAAGEPLSSYDRHLAQIEFEREKALQTPERARGYTYNDLCNPVHRADGPINQDLSIESDKGMEAQRHAFGSVLDASHKAGAASPRRINLPLSLDMHLTAAAAPPPPPPPNLPLSLDMHDISKARVKEEEVVEQQQQLMQEMASAVNMIRSGTLALAEAEEKAHATSSLQVMTRLAACSEAACSEDVSSTSGSVQRVLTCSDEVQRAVRMSPQAACSEDVSSTSTISYTLSASTGDGEMTSFRHPTENLLSSIGETLDSTSHTVDATSDSPLIAAAFTSAWAPPPLNTSSQALIPQSESGAQSTTKAKPWLLVRWGKALLLQLLYIVHLVLHILGSMLVLLAADLCWMRLARALDEHGSLLCATSSLLSVRSMDAVDNLQCYLRDAIKNALSSACRLIRKTPLGLSEVELVLCASTAEPMQQMVLFLVLCLASVCAVGVIVQIAVLAPLRALKRSRCGAYLGAGLLMFILVLQSLSCLSGTSLSQSLCLMWAHARQDILDYNIGGGIISRCLMWTHARFNRDGSRAHFAADGSRGAQGSQGPAALLSDGIGAPRRSGKPVHNRLGMGTIRSQGDLEGIDWEGPEWQKAFSQFRAEATLEPEAALENVTASAPEPEELVSGSKGDPASGLLPATEMQHPTDPSSAPETPHAELSPHAHAENEPYTSIVSSQLPHRPAVVSDVQSAWGFVSAFSWAETIRGLNATRW